MDEGKFSGSTTAAISTDYLRLQQELHRNPRYGAASILYAPLVKQLMMIAGVGSLSDYGAGKKNLQARLHQLGLSNFDYFPYDPAFPEYGRPRPADLVCCIDVLEHIEPDRLDSVLAELATITRAVGFFTIHTGPAKKVLPDGRNAHLIQEGCSWWLPKLCQHFEIRHLHSAGMGFWLMVEPRGTAPKLALHPADILHFASLVRKRVGPYPGSPLARWKERMIGVPGVLARTLFPPAQYLSLRRKLQKLRAR
jgi:hypothetical protein